MVAVLPFWLLFKKSKDLWGHDIAKMPLSRATWNSRANYCKLPEVYHVFKIKLTEFSNI